MTIDASGDVPTIAYDSSLELAIGNGYNSVEANTCGATSTMAPSIGPY
jgi:hypothetical protein